MDYIVLVGLILFLLIYFRIDRKNFSDFFYKDAYSKFIAVRLYFILIVVILLLSLKIMKNH